MTDSQAKKFALRSVRRALAAEISGKGWLTFTVEGFDRPVFNEDMEFCFEIRDLRGQHVGFVSYPRTIAVREDEMIPWSLSVTDETLHNLPVNERGVDWREAMQQRAEELGL
jgi:hypothetical protein